MAKKSHAELFTQLGRRTVVRGARRTVEVENRAATDCSDFGGCHASTLFRRRARSLPTTNKGAVMADVIVRGGLVVDGTDRRRSMPTC